MRGPKRATKVRKFFNLSKEDDVRKYINTCRRKKRNKAPKIQRLVTSVTIHRKRARIAEKKRRVQKAQTEAAEYQKLVAFRQKAQWEHRSEGLAKERSFRASVATKAEAAAA